MYPAYACQHCPEVRNITLLHRLIRRLRAGRHCSFVHCQAVVAETFLVAFIQELLDMKESQCNTKWNSSIWFHKCNNQKQPSRLNSCPCPQPKISIASDFKGEWIFARPLPLFPSFGWRMRHWRHRSLTVLSLLTPFQDSWDLSLPDCGPRFSHLYSGESTGCSLRAFCLPTESRILGLRNFYFLILL